MIVNESKNFAVPISGPFSLTDTLNCGQAFRWFNDGEYWCGVAHSRFLALKFENGVLKFYNTTKLEYEHIWREYFDLDRDYNIILKTIGNNDILREAANFAGGIRVLRQEPWETLCSFIISQNNNIPRIKKIIGSLSETFGKDLGDGNFSFPSAETLARLSIEDLSPIRCGFRAKYILDAATKVASGDIDLNLLSSIPLDDARKELTRIYGVGDKVADCTLLFGLGHIEAFPKDVWIKRAMEKLFGGILPKEAIPYAGIVQQYIFHYARMTKLSL